MVVESVTPVMAMRREFGVPIPTPTPTPAEVEEESPASTSTSAKISKPGLWIDSSTPFSSGARSVGRGEAGTTG
jgi:hypothetical protein